MPEADDRDLLGDPARSAEQQDELENAEVLPFVHAQQSPISGARCVNGNLVRPDNAEEEPPSTACRQSAVNAPGGVALGRGPPPPVPHAPAASTAANSPRVWVPLNTQSEASGGGGPPDGTGRGKPGCGVPNAGKGACLPFVRLGCTESVRIWAGNCNNRPFPGQRERRPLS